VESSIELSTKPEQALQKLLPYDWSIDNSRWGTVEIVNPGQTVSGTFQS
jgi:hypothetical protein